MWTQVFVSGTSEALCELTVIYNSQVESSFVICWGTTAQCTNREEDKGSWGWWIRTNSWGTVRRQLKCYCFAWESKQKRCRRREYEHVVATEACEAHFPFGGVVHCLIAAVAKVLFHLFSLIRAWEEVYIPEFWFPLSCFPLMNQSSVL